MASTPPPFDAYMTHPFDIRPWPPGCIPSTAFGFVLNDQYRRRWAQGFLDKHYDPDGLDRAAKSPAQNERTLSSAMLIMNSVIPAHVYHAVPDLPVRRRRRLLPVKEAGALIPRLYVFVLQEDVRTMPHTPEHVARVREALDLGDDHEPTWVPIDRESV